MKVDIGEVGDVIAILFQPSNHVVFPAGIVNRKVLSRTWLEICEEFACSNTSRSARGRAGITQSQHVWAIEGDLPRTLPGSEIIQRPAIGPAGPEIVGLESSHTRFEQEI